MAKKILIIDDEPDILSVVKFRLEKFGYSVSTATNGKEALEAISGQHPDLILLDLVLPLISGFDICKKIKESEKTKHIPVILFTASVTDVPAKVTQAGADDYILKPFDTDKLIEKIRRLAG